MGYKFGRGFESLQLHKKKYLEHLEYLKYLEFCKMDNKEFGKKLEIRTRKFALAVIKWSSSLPNTAEGKVLRNQLTKSGTSVGANYREANRSRSTREFKSKIKICEEEANETVYWIELISDTEWVSNIHLDWILKESGELLAIFTSISSKLN